jgi:hypothetical protein
MVHGVIGMRGIIQVLVEIPAFDPNVFIESPAKAGKKAGISTSTWMMPRIPITPCTI